MHQWQSNLIKSNQALFYSRRHAPSTFLSARDLPLPSATTTTSLTGGEGREGQRGSKNVRGMLIDRPAAADRSWPSSAEVINFRRVVDVAGCFIGPSNGAALSSSWRARCLRRYAACPVSSWDRASLPWLARDPVDIAADPLTITDLCADASN